MHWSAASAMTATVTRNTRTSAGIRSMALSRNEGPSTRAPSAITSHASLTHLDRRSVSCSESGSTICVWKSSPNVGSLAALPSRSPWTRRIAAARSCHAPSWRSGRRSSRASSRSSRVASSVEPTRTGDGGCVYSPSAAASDLRRLVAGAPCGALACALAASGREGAPIEWRRAADGGATDEGCGTGSGGGSSRASSRASQSPQPAAGERPAPNTAPPMCNVPSGGSSALSAGTGGGADKA